MLFCGVFLRESARTAAKSRTNLSTNSGKATKRLGRLAPNLAHMCKFIWEWIYAKQISPRDTRGHLVFFMGSTIQKYGEAVRLTPTWFTSADSSGNGHRLNTNRPSIPQGAFRGGGGGLGCHKLKSSGKLSNVWTDWHKVGTHLHIHLGMDTCQTNCPSRHKGGTLGVLGVKLQKSWEALTRLHRLAPNLYTSAHSSGNGHRLNTIRPPIPQGHFWGF